MKGFVLLLLASILFSPMYNFVFADGSERIDCALGKAKCDGKYTLDTLRCNKTRVLSLNMAQREYNSCIADGKSESYCLIRFNTKQNAIERVHSSCLKRAEFNYEICLRRFYPEIRITLPDGSSQVFKGDCEETILDSAERKGLDLPFGSRSGSDSSSAAFMRHGAVDQSEQSFLSDEQIERGLILIDVAYPLTDLDISMYTPKINEELSR